MTNNWKDYFNSEEEYAEHLAKYLDFKEDKEECTLKALKDFCEREVNGGHNGKVGIYYDAKEPIINRNVVKAIMYGNEKLLSACAEPVTYDEIEEYYKKISSLQDVFKKGAAENEDEQIKLREFQNEKNRIELLNLSIYSEIVNELMSKLISWAYLRERDLMYFQLGWQYIKLFYTDSIGQEDKRRQISSKELKIDIKDGAVLYQIIAMYTHGVPIYNEEGGEWKGVVENESTGVKVMAFVNAYGNEVYVEGLRLFEVEKAHDKIVQFRNYIDHFKYQAKLDRNILELYSFYYDMMFSYSPKLRKSVPVVFNNILKRSFTVADLKFNKEYDDGHKKSSLQIIDKIKSEKFTYKCADGTKPEINARGEIFLNELKKILEYKSDK